MKSTAFKPLALPSPPRTCFPPKNIYLQYTQMTLTCPLILSGTERLVEGGAGAVSSWRKIRMWFIDEILIRGDRTGDGTKMVQLIDGYGAGGKRSNSLTVKEH